MSSSSGLKREKKKTQLNVSTSRDSGFGPFAVICTLQDRVSGPGATRNGILVGPSYRSGGICLKTPVVADEIRLRRAELACSGLTGDEAFPSGSN